MTMVMHAVTLHRPWPEPVLTVLDGKTYGVKPVENRTWAPHERFIGKRIAIHAGRKYSEDGADFCRDRGFSLLPRTASDGMRSGRIVGTVELCGVLRLRDDGKVVVSLGKPRELERDDVMPWFVGPSGWLFRKPIALGEPVKWRGRQGLWALPRKVEHAVRSQEERWLDAG